VAVYNRWMRKTSRTYRGDMMRQIAALHAKIAVSDRERRGTKLGIAERVELKRQIQALEKKLMEL